MPQRRVILPARRSLGGGGKRHSADESLRKRWLLVGLGNPGTKYDRTRHNLGARIVESLRRDLKLPVLKTHTALRARITSNGSLMLAVPTTFMNTSGRAIGALLQDVHLTPDRLVIIHDDKDLTFGAVKLQKNRSAAGHRGVGSVIDTLGTKDFWRLRVGIGVPPLGTPMEEYVLQRFTATEEQVLKTSGVFMRAHAILRTHMHKVRYILDSREKNRQPKKP